MADTPGSAAAEPRGVRPWTVRALGLLLLLQAIAYVVLSLYLLSRLAWSEASVARMDFVMTPQEIEAFSVSFVLIPSAALAVVSAVGFLFLHRAGWLLAMLMQGATLLGCLTLYFELRPQPVYPVMLFCILMAFYLNSTVVRSAFYGGMAGHER